MVLEKSRKESFFSLKGSHFVLSGRRRKVRAKKKRERPFHNCGEGFPGVLAPIISVLRFEQSGRFHSVGRKGVVSEKASEGVREIEKGLFHPKGSF